MENKETFSSHIVDANGNLIEVSNLNLYMKNASFDEKDEIIGHITLYYGYDSNGNIVIGELPLNK